MSFLQDGQNLSPKKSFSLTMNIPEIIHLEISTSDSSSELMWTRAFSVKQL